MGEKPRRCIYCGRVGLFPIKGRMPMHKIPAKKSDAPNLRCVPLTGKDALWCKGSDKQVIG